MERRRILVIDDDDSICGYLGLVLGLAGYEVQTAATSAEAVAKTASFQPHLLIVDLVLPGLNGIELSRRLCDEGRRPVLILSGMSGEADVLASAAGAAGAREFLRKPVKQEALFEAISRQLGVEAAGGPGDRLERGRLRMDLGRRQVWLDGRLLGGIGPKRFDLLRVLMLHRDGASRETLLREVWGEHENPKTLDVTVHRLRQDLSHGSGGDRTIAAIPDGYKLVV